MCPGTETLGSCGTGGCGGAFQSSGKCIWNGTADVTPQAKLLAHFVKSKSLIGANDIGSAQCKCTGHTVGDDCQSCMGYRAGNECDKCKPGRFGPACKACPGLVPADGGKDDPAAVCGGFGAGVCIGAGRLQPNADAGTCDCPYNYDSLTNCTTCSTGFWGLDKGCIQCSCSARLTNATAKVECLASAVCSGNGHCKGDDPSSTVCVQCWFQRAKLWQEGGDGLGRRIFGIVVIASRLGGVHLEKELEQRRRR